MKRFLITIMGLGFLGAMMAGYLVFTGPRMTVQPHVRTFARPMPLPPDGAIPVAVDRPTATSPAELAAFVSAPATDENMRKGAVVYGYYCAFCHGQQGAGDGPVGESYVPRPADLRSHRVAAFSDGELLRAMLTGVGHEPALERVVHPEHRWYLVTFVRSLAEAEGGQ